MDRQEIIECVAHWFGIEPDEGYYDYDTNSYNWQAGCYLSGSTNGTFLNLAEVVDCIEDMMEDIG